MAGLTGAPALGRGISLGGALDDGRPDGGTWLREAHFDAVRAAGFDAVGLPVKWSAYQGSAPPHRVASAFLARVDRAVEWALARGLAVVLDVHHFDVSRRLATRAAGRRRAVGSSTRP